MVRGRLSCNVASPIHFRTFGCRCPVYLGPLQRIGSPCRLSSCSFQLSSFVDPSLFGVSSESGHKWFGGHKHTPLLAWLHHSSHSHVLSKPSNGILKDTNSQWSKLPHIRYTAKLERLTATTSSSPHVCSIPHFCNL